MDKINVQKTSMFTYSVRELDELARYAFVSHESAVEAIWSLAARKWEGVLNDEEIWLIPSPESCVTTQRDFKQLAREVDLAALGIHSTPVDLLAPDKSCYSRGKLARFHVWANFFAPHSFVRVQERVFVSTPYFAALQLAMARPADRLSREEARRSADEDARIRHELGLDGSSSTPQELVQWGNIRRMVRAAQVLCDFMGTYRYVPEQYKARPEDDDVAYQTKPIIKPRTFARYLDEMAETKGITRARKVCALAFEGSASPMETALALMLTLPVDMGGFGLPRPELNHEIPIEEPMRDLAAGEVFFADLCWPNKKVAVEYYGWKEHFCQGPSKVASDFARANSLTALGWRVLHVTFEQARTVPGISLLARQVAHELGFEMRTPSDLEHVWRARLLALMLPKVSRKP